MPLSEDEQRILREIEENLSATDPKLVQQVSDTTLYRHSARVIKWSVVGFIAGLALMIATFTTTLSAGTYTITAVYSGDLDFTTSTSSVQQKVK